MNSSPKTAAEIKKFKERLLRRLQLPSDALPGSLSVTKLRCGKAKCHCNDGDKHENWTLTYMAGGKKQVKHIPRDLVAYVKKKVEEGKLFKEDVNQILVANAELLVLLRKQKHRS